MDQEDRRYRVEPIWEGGTVFCIAGGASLTLSQVRLIGMAKRRPGVRVIAVNDAVYPAAFADIAYACDTSWWDHHKGVPWFPRLRLCYGIRNVPPRGSFMLPEDPGIMFVEGSGTEGLDADPQRLRSGGNSGYQVIQLAANLGATRVVLVAYDMQGEHWFGQHPEGQLRRSPVFATRISQFNVLANGLRDRGGVTVVNASPGSALHAFPFVSLEAECFL